MLKNRPFSWRRLGVFGASLAVCSFAWATHIPVAYLQPTVGWASCLRRDNPPPHAPRVSAPPSDGVSRASALDTLASGVLRSVQPADIEPSLDCSICLESFGAGNKPSVPAPLTVCLYVRTPVLGAAQEQFPPRPSCMPHANFRVHMYFTVDASRNG